MDIHDSQDSMERERAFLTPFSHLQPLEKHFNINRAITKECSPLRKTGTPVQIGKPYLRQQFQIILTFSECTHIFLVVLLKENLPVSNI